MVLGNVDKEQNRFFTTIHVVNRLMSSASSRSRLLRNQLDEEKSYLSQNRTLYNQKGHMVGRHKLLLSVKVTIVLVSLLSKFSPLSLIAPMGMIQSALFSCKEFQDAFLMRA